MHKYVKRSLGMFVAICIAIISVVVNTSVASASLNEQIIEVSFRQVIELPDTSIIDTDLLESAIEAGSVTGWDYNEAEQQFERFVVYPDIEVAVDGIEVDLDANGITRMLALIDEIVEVTVYDPVTQKVYSQQIGGDSTNSIIIFDLDISDMFSIDVDNENLEKTSPLLRASATDPYWTDGEQGVYGYRLHCNRFNGYLGNGRYYSSNISPQSLLNFFGSDCDWALGSASYCLDDYGSNPFCAASPSSKQASCSTFIGHYNRFHMHTTYSG